MLDGFATPEELGMSREDYVKSVQKSNERIKNIMKNPQENYPDELFEEAARREKENKVLEIAKNFIEEHSEAMEQLAEIERKEFYRFFVVEYFATGEGISYWLKICRNYGLYDGKDYEMERFKEFIGCSHYYPGIEELTEKEFVEKYASLIPAHVTKMLAKRDQPMLDWETHFYVNYS